MAGAKPQRASRAKVKFMFYSKYKEKLLGGFKPGRDAVIGLWRGAFGVLEGGLYGARAAERRQWPGLAQVKKWVDSRFVEKAEVTGIADTPEGEKEDMVVKNWS